MRQTLRQAERLPGVPLTPIRPIPCSYPLLLFLCVICCSCSINGSWRTIYELPFRPKCNAEICI